MSKQIRCSLLFLFATAALAAQDWAPFPLGLPAFYRTSIGEVNCYFADSAVQNTDKYRLFFMREDYVQPFDSCLLLGNLTDIYPQSIIENMLLHGDSLLMDSSGNVVAQDGASDRLLFPSRAAPGDTVASAWAFGGGDEAVFVCTEQFEGLVMGIPDSLKRFRAFARKNGAPIPTALDTLDFLLSRRFGFVSFCPFYFLKKNMAPRQWTMVGMEYRGEAYGFTNRFADYVQNYRAGDVLLQIERDHLWPPYLYCYRDSILNVTVHDTLVTLSVTRLTRIFERYYSQSMPPPRDSLVRAYTIPEYKLRYSKRQFDEKVSPYLVNRLPYTIGTEVHRLSVTPTGGFRLYGYHDGLIVNFSSCMGTGFADYPDTWGWDTQLGFMERVHGWFPYPDWLELYGYFRADSVLLNPRWNECDILISSPTHALERTTLSIWPNPSDGHWLMLRTDEDAPLPAGLRITDSMGRTVSADCSVDGGNGLFRVNFSDRLPAGMYLLSLYDRSGAGQIARFVVLR